MPALSDTVVGIVEDFGVPVPTDVVRVVASSRRGEPVRAESLSRLAAAQRESFVRKRMAPRLCSVLDKDGRPLRPRVWAIGTWHLSRRIATEDVLAGWKAGLGIALCDEMIRTPDAGEDLARTSLVAVGRVLGSVATYIPGCAAEWSRLRGQLAGFLPGLGLSASTSAQLSAARRLEEHTPAIPPAALYFGLDDDVRLAPDEADPALLRLPRAGEQGEPFDRVVFRRLSQDEQGLRSVIAYLQQFDHLMDDLGRAPTSEEYASAWRSSPDEVRREENLFRRAFPEERTAERIMRLLDRALPSFGPMTRVMATRVIDMAPNRDGSTGPVARPAPGQRWESPDRGRHVTLVDVAADRLFGTQHDNRTERNSTWQGTSDDLREWTLSLPHGVWRGQFDLLEADRDILDRLIQAGLTVERLARPGDPRAHGPWPAASVEVLVGAADEREALEQITDALDSIAVLDAQSVRLHPMGSTTGASE
jgi:hypothetical protein